MKILAKLSYVHDWSSNDGNDQNGRIIVEPDPGGKITASWEYRDGKGRVVGLPMSGLRRS